MYYSIMYSPVAVPGISAKVHVAVNGHGEAEKGVNADDSVAPPIDVVGVPSASQNRDQVVQGARHLQTVDWK